MAIVDFKKIQSLNCLNVNGWWFMKFWCDIQLDPFEKTIVDFKDWSISQHYYFFNSNFELFEKLSKLVLLERKNVYVIIWFQRLFLKKNAWPRLRHS